MGVSMSRNLRGKKFKKKKNDVSESETPIRPELPTIQEFDEFGCKIEFDAKFTKKYGVPTTKVRKK